MSDKTAEPVDKSKWPIGVRTMSLWDTQLLGIDDKGHLYWDGKELVTRQVLSLSRLERFLAGAAALAAVALAAIELLRFFGYGIK